MKIVSFIQHFVFVNFNQERMVILSCFNLIVRETGCDIQMGDETFCLVPPPPIFFPTHNSFFNTSDSYQFEIRGRLRLVSVLFSSLVLYIGHLEKSFPESIM